MASQRILFQNIARCTGADGSPARYVLETHRHFTPGRHKSAVIPKILKMVDEESPDVCVFVEVDRDSPLVKAMQERYPYSALPTKYRPGQPVRKLPYFDKQCHAIFSKTPFKDTNHYFPRGFKRLLVELQFEDGLKLFVSHFSLRRPVRRRQFSTLAEIAGSHTRTIICGDFNTFAGPVELDPLLKKTGLKLANLPTDLTFPTYAPRQALDLFLHSPDIQLEEFRVLRDVRFSDHLPIAFTFA